LRTIVSKTTPSEKGAGEGGQNKNPLSKQDEGEGGGQNNKYVTVTDKTDNAETLPLVPPYYLLSVDKYDLNRFGLAKVYLSCVYAYSRAPPKLCASSGEHNA